MKEKWGEYLINSKMKIEIKYNSPLEEKLTSSEEGKEWKGESLGGVAQLENAVSKRKSGKRKVGDRYTKMQKKIMYEWIKGHNEWPYPSQSVKKQLALLAGITTYKVLTMSVYIYIYILDKHFLQQLQESRMEFKGKGKG